MHISSKRFLALVCGVLLATVFLFGLWKIFSQYIASRQMRKTELSVTIPEGWNAREIGLYLAAQHIIPTAADFERVSAPHATTSIIFSDTLPFLKEKPGDTGLEGYLFPDTYRLYVQALPEQVATKMLQNFNTKFSPELRAQAARQHHSIFEIVTIASLIEKEVASDEDRAIVSGILWKRLTHDMPLQVDATIAYITGKRSINISHAETEIDSPYNTYLYRGLPKGPISNPGLSAIRAALYPRPSPYLYYLSTPDNKIIFSRTLKEHNRAKAKYLK